MARETLDRKLHHLLSEVLIMSSLVETALLESVEALKKRDLDLARRVYAGDTQINAKRFELENDIIITIATTQPVMAGDLRLVASILEVVGELERIGDYAKGIARIALRLGNQPPVKPLIDIPRMAEISVDMLHRAVTAFINQDAELARQIPAEDDQVDNLYNQIYRELVAIMLGDPSTIDRANYLLWVAHNLERVADRVTNICERAIYTATGQLMEFAPSDDEVVESLK
jgi:phosphate transport system protein